VHELSIASAMLSAAREEAQRHPRARPVTLGVRVGTLAGVDPEALRFCFGCLTKGTDLESLGLDIEQRSQRNKCRQCRLSFEVSDYQTQCPGCGAAETDCVSGHELELVYLEGVGDMARVTMERKVLSENDRLAGRLREGFRRSGVLCLNLISSPGAGKTALLERTLEGFDVSARVAVLTGDIQTDNDAVRLARFGFPVRQITTGGACHLDARMVERGLSGWALDQLEMLFVENVGNLVCPSSYDLGEAAKVVIVGLTEVEAHPVEIADPRHQEELSRAAKDRRLLP
jgi:hydrogenase accessory protein HypB/hydrogenase nickel insertion protein HypA